MSVSSYRLPARLVGLGLLLAFLAVFVYGRTLEAQRTRPFGHFNEPQILERASAISSTLLTNSGTLCISTRHYLGKKRDGTLHPFWVVKYSNDPSDTLLLLEFDGETGDLLFLCFCPAIGSSYPTQSARLSGLVTKAAILKLSRDWVYTLGLAPKMAPWQVTHNALRYGSMWLIIWKCRDHLLHFTFDHKTGRLMMAQLQVQV